MNHKIIFILITNFLFLASTSIIAMEKTIELEEQEIYFTEFTGIKELIQIFYGDGYEKYTISEEPKQIIANYFKPVVINLDNDENLEDWEIVRIPDHQDDLLKSYVLVEDDFMTLKNESKIIKEPLLNLELLDTEQSNQPNIRYKNCTIYHYKKTIIDKVFSGFTDPKDCTVRELFRIIPDVIRDNRKNSSSLIHGTNGEKNRGYYEPKNPLFQAYFNCAIALAALEGRTVDLKSIKWNGSHFGKNRQRAAKEFSRLIEAWDWFYEYNSIMAFSHGANLSLIASNDLKKAHILFGLFFGCPVRDWLRIYGADNIPLILNNYSRHDPIQKLGKFAPISWFLSWWHPSMRDLCRERVYEGGRLFNPHEESIITNISMSDNRKRPRHGTIASEIAPHLPQLMKYMLKVYKNRNAVQNLSLNIVPDKKVDKYGVKKYNLTISEPHSQAEKERQQKIPLKFHKISTEELADHKKVYKQPKDNERWIYTQYCLFTNFFKDTFHANE